MTKTRVLLLILSATLCFAAPVHAQSNVKATTEADLPQADRERLHKFVEYDHDVYARYKLIDGYVMPSSYYLLLNGKYIEIKEDELEGYLYEEEDGKYYVFGVDEQKYLLAFKPEIAEIMEKDEAYFKKCEKVKKDYMAHPERYRDVTIIDEATNESTGSYIDRNGYEWVLESEMHGFYLLEREKVYVLRDELRFIQKK